MTWQEINRKRMPFIRMGEWLFKAMYGEIRKGLIASFYGLTLPEQFIEAARGYVIDEDIVRTAYEKFYTKTSMAFAKNVQKSARRGIETKQEEDWIKRIIEYVRVNTGTRISEVIKTSYKDIERIARAAVETGISEGWGMDKIARLIQKQQGELDLWKALRIARTEVVAASNEGVKMGAEDLPGSKSKVWISTFDDRARPDHMAMDGVTVPSNELFTLPSGVKLEYPGDPTVNAPEEVINCRCGYEIIIQSEYY